MAEMDVLLRAIDAAHWELSEAFIGIPDEDVWKRPHPSLLSIGELAAHMAHGEGQMHFGDDFKSALSAEPAWYYTKNVGDPFQFPMSAEAVFSEVRRVHEECKASYLADPQPGDELNVHRGDWTWEYTFIYLAFHIAYHTGQIYSVRHLLGHETPNN